MTNLVSTIRRAQRTSRAIALLTTASVFASLVAPYAIAVREAWALDGLGSDGSQGSASVAANLAGDLATDGLSVPQTSGAASSGLASINPSSGAAVASFPFALPPARGRVQPTLGLAYMSGSGEGDAGIGWRLSGLHSIERRGPAGQPAPGYAEPSTGGDWNAVDTFYFDGAPLAPLGTTRAGRDVATGEAVPGYAANDWFEYRRVVDDGGAYRFFYSPNHRTWVLQTKSETMQFGAALDNQTPEATDIDGPTGNVFRWRLARRADNQVTPSGTLFVNPILYVWNQTTLTDIYYTPNASGGFESLQFDQFESHIHLWWRAHPYNKATPPVWRATTNALLTRVDVTAKPINGDGARELTRLYTIRYQDNATADWHHAHLAGITQEGRCIAPAATIREDATFALTAADPACPPLPEVTFDYSLNVPQAHTHALAPAPDLYTQLGWSPSKARYAIFDANADGLPDALATAFDDNSSDTTQRLLLNNQGQGFMPRTVALPDAIRNSLGNPSKADVLGPQTMFVGDWYGDGKANLWGLGEFPWHFYQGNGTPPPRSDGPSTGKFALYSLDDTTMTWTLGTPVGNYDYRIPGDSDAMLVAPGCYPVDVNADGMLDCFLFHDRWWGGDHYANPDYQQRLPLGFAVSTKDRAGNITLPIGNGGPIAPQGASVGVGVPTLGTAPRMHGDGFKPDGVHPASDASSAQSSRIYDRMHRPDGTPLGTWSNPYYFADVDGDGIVDMIIPKHYTTSGELQFWRGHGDGWFGEDGCAGNTQGQADCWYKTARPTADIDPPFFLDPDSNEIDFHDIDGDGLADLIVHVEDGLHIHRNVGLPAWFDSNEIVLRNGQELPEWEQHEPQDPANTHVGFADMNGNGTDDIVLIGHYINYVDLFDQTPNLLTKIHNGLGGDEIFTYTSSALLVGNAIDSTTAHIPQAVQVVTQIERTNNLPGPNFLDAFVRYDYTNPVYDPRAHAFRGFRNVVERHVGMGAQSVAPGSVIARTYAFGACPTSAGHGCTEGVDNVYQAIKALPLVVDTSDDQLSIYHSTVHRMYEVRQLFHALDGRVARLVYPSQTDTFFYDSVPTTTSTVPIDDLNVIDATDRVKLAPSTTYVTTHAASGYARTSSRVHLDDHGNADLVTSLGRTPAGGTTSADADKPITTLYKFYDAPIGAPGSWMWRVHTTQTFQGLASAPTGPVRDRTMVYDPNGNVTDVQTTLAGSEAMRRSHQLGKEVASDAPNRSQDGSITLYHAVPDQYGNAAHIKLAGGRCLEVDYDGAFSHYAQHTTSYAGTGGAPCGSVQFDSYDIRDRGWGESIEQIGVSGDVTANGYDAFGRVIAVYEPDPTVPNTPSAVASVTYDYLPSPAEKLTRVRVRSLYKHTPLSPTVQLPFDRTSYVISDAFGRGLATFQEAEGTPDTGKWVIAGRTDTSPSGVLLQTHVATFTNDEPLAFSGHDASPQAFDRYQYDAFGRVTRHLGLDGALLSSTGYHVLSKDIYDAETLVVGGPHANLPSTLVSDGFGRIKKQISRARVDMGLGGDPLDETSTTMTYLATGELTSVTKTHSLKPSEQFVRTMTYDTMGRMIRNYEPNTRWVQGTSWPDSSYWFQGPSWQYAYDDAGDLVGTTDARGCGKNLFYDQGGRLVAEDFSPCLASHADHSKPSLTDGTGTEAFYRYDAVEAGQSATPAQAAAALGRLVSVADRGSYTRMLHDLRGRTTQVQRKLAQPGIPDPSLAARYAQSWFTSDATYDDANRVSTQTTGAAALLPAGGSSVVTTNYSARGLIDSVTSSYGDILKSAAYDADGAPLAMQYADAAGTVASYTYQSNNGLRQLSELKIARTSGPWQSCSTSGAGQQSCSYKTPSHADGTVEGVLLDDQFLYDRVGNPTDIIDARSTSSDAGDWPAGAKPMDRHIDYDDNYRVTKVTYKSGGDAASLPLKNVKGAVPAVAQQGRLQWQSFTYDWLGNLYTTADDAQNGAGAFFDRSSGVHLRSSNTPPNQFTSAVNGTNSVVPTYDNGGYIVSMVVQRSAVGCTSPAGCTHRFDYDWDEVGRLAEARRWDYSGPYPSSAPHYPAQPTATPAADLKFAYDASNNRVLKVANDGDGPFFNAEIFPTLRLNHAAWQGSDYQSDKFTETPYLVAGGVAFARVAYAKEDWPTLTSGALHVFLELGDHLGSASVIIDRDSGELVERATYDAFGQEESDVQPARWKGFREDYRFTGKELDAEIGLTYFGQRYYCAAIGQWMSADPLAVHALGADLNPYAYVHGNVLGAIDPNGLNDVVISNDEHGDTVQTFSPDIIEASPPPPPPPTPEAVANGMKPYDGPALNLSSMPPQAPIPSIPLTPEQQANVAWMSQYHKALDEREEFPRYHREHPLEIAVCSMPFEMGAGLADILAEKGAARFGSAASNDYKATFFKANPETAGSVVVHHAVEQQVLTRYPGLVSESQMHSLENLRGIPKAINSEVHLSSIRKSWNSFYRTNSNPTLQQLLDHATTIDNEFGAQFNPPVR